MHWFRSHRLKITSLALFALACQLVLSFGHVHLDRFAGNSSHFAIAGGGKSIAATARKLTLVGLPTSPRQKDQKGADDFCAICASISLAGTLVVPVAPALLADDLSFDELHWSLAENELRSIDHFHFNARGPPTA